MGIRIFSVDYSTRREVFKYRYIGSIIINIIVPIFGWLMGWLTEHTVKYFDYTKNELKVLGRRLGVGVALGTFWGPVIAIIMLLGFISKLNALFLIAFLIIMPLSICLGVFCIKKFHSVYKTIEDGDAEVARHRRMTSTNSLYGKAWIIVGIIITIGIIIINISTVASNNPTSYAVTLDFQGGVGGTSIVYAYENRMMPQAVAPSREGYDFAGYFTGIDGDGTKYYDSNMNSVRAWDQTSSDTLYADWTPKYGIELTRRTFETYFNFSSSCSVIRDGFYTSGTATYTFSISPKSSFNYDLNSRNPDFIIVIIGLEITGMRKTWEHVPGQYKIEITLYKSRGYSYSGSRDYTAGTLENYWNDGIYSVDTIIYN